MARPKSDRPAYCRHKRTHRGYVTIDGKQRFLPGGHGSAVSRAAYERLIGRWLAAGRQLPAEADPTSTGPTVTMVCLAFYRFSLTHYVGPAGRPTGEADNYRVVIKALRKLYGAKPAATFLPVDLKGFRRAMLEPREVPEPKDQRKKVMVPGWSRTYANRQARRVARIFKWAASESMLPKAMADALETVEDIRKGREGARESKPVHAVPADVVEATLPHLPPPVAALVKLQLLSGTRGGELLKLRTCDVDRSSLPWKFTPEHHKTAHHNKKRVIRFGPKAREVLTPFLNLADPEAFLFRPLDAVAWRNLRQREKRRTPITPSQRLRAEQAAQRYRRLRPHYGRQSYAQAIERAAKAAGLPHWHPHQLRHTASTNYRRESDRETAKIIAGQTTDAIAERYAERDDRAADAAVERVG
jgi:integrase